ncbi:MAG: ribbon-helix-helix protein, CopG family, partial [Chitinivibrionales bacterium]|nr:ribbon-helix-helix protein, CopG family [Chitinivibrionales bacterium]
WLFLATFGQGPHLKGRRRMPPRARRPGYHGRRYLESARSWRLAGPYLVGCHHHFPVYIICTYVPKVVHRYPGVSMQSSTLHIKVKPEVAQGLKELAARRQVPVGELVREAVASTYQIETTDLNERQRRALAAFQGGYISFGKLSEEMGLTVWELRTWLDDHGIGHETALGDNDVDNA